MRFLLGIITGVLISVSTIAYAVNYNSDIEPLKNVASDLYQRLELLEKTVGIESKPRLSVGRY